MIARPVDVFVDPIYQAIDRIIGVSGAWRSTTFQGWSAEFLLYINTVMRDEPTSNSGRAARLAIDAEWQRLGIHRASQAAQPRTWSTGLAELDRVLPGGGYPLASVTEWLIERPGTGELSLLLASLSQRLAAGPSQRLVMINPPYGLNAPALDAAAVDRRRLPLMRCRTPAEAVWSIEQLAAAGGFVAFVLWEDQLEMTDLRRLQLASEKAGCPVFVYRSLHCARQRSPAALRLALTQRSGRQRIEILKCRGPGGARVDGLQVGRDHPWHGGRVPPAIRLGRVHPQPSNNEATAAPPSSALIKAQEEGSTSICFKAYKNRHDRPD